MQLDVFTARNFSLFIFTTKELQECFKASSSLAGKKEAFRGQFTPRTGSHLSLPCHSTTGTNHVSSAMLQLLFTVGKGAALLFQDCKSAVIIYERFCSC